MSNAGPGEGTGGTFRTAALAFVPLLVAALIGALVGEIRSGLVIGAGVGFGLASAVAIRDRLAGR